MKLDGLIQIAQLVPHLGAPQLRILDATAFLEPRPDGLPGYVPRSGRMEWELEHIAGAQHIDLVSDFSDVTSPFPFTMPSADRFCALLSIAGLSDDSQVVIYSAGSVMWATRLFWMLRSIGFQRCAVLDGGLSQWKAQGHPTTTQAVTYPPGKITNSPSLFGWATQAEIVDSLDQGGKVCVIDALSPRDYSGASAKYGGKGHIPNSHNVFYNALLRDDGTFLPVEELKQRLAASKALHRERVICYCGGGIASTMTALALYLCGHRNVAVYDGSMLEWASNKALPLTLGELP